MSGFFGIYKGTVVNNADPENAGRLTALVPGVLGPVPTTWALPVRPPGITLAIPEPGTLVWVMFEGGDVSSPVWAGVGAAQHLTKVLSDVVTLTTDQTITGSKTFSAATNFNGGVVSTGGASFDSLEVSGATTFRANETLLRADAGDTILRIETDPANAGASENDHPRIIFSQDSRLVNARVGYAETGDSNEFEVVNEQVSSLHLGTANTTRLTIGADGRLTSHTGLVTLTNGNSEIASTGNLYLRGGGGGSVVIQPNTGLPSAVVVDQYNIATFGGLLRTNASIDLANSGGGTKSIFTWTSGDANWRIGMHSDNTGTPGTGAGFVRKYATSHVQYVTYGQSSTQGFAVGAHNGAAAAGTLTSHLEVRGSDGHTFIRNSLEVGGSTSFAGNTTMSGNAHTLYGPNTSWGSYLRVGGNGHGVGAETASVATTDGNLHLDAASGGNSIYLNWYGGTTSGGTLFGNGAGAQVGRVDRGGTASFSGFVYAHNGSTYVTRVGELYGGAGVYTTTTQHYDAAGNDFRWSSANTERMRLTAAGNLAFTGMLTGGTVPWARLSDVPTNFVTTDTTQTITGAKTFSAEVWAGSSIGSGRAFAIGNASGARGYEWSYTDGGTGTLTQHMYRWGQELAWTFGSAAGPVEAMRLSNTTLRVVGNVTSGGWYYAAGGLRPDTDTGGDTVGVHTPGATVTWDTALFKATTLWENATASEYGGSTKYVTLGAVGNKAGIMLANPHVVNSVNSESGAASARIRYGRVGGLTTGAYWDAGILTKTTDAWGISRNGVQALNVTRNNVFARGYANGGSGGQQWREYANVATYGTNTATVTGSIIFIAPYNKGNWMQTHEFVGYNYNKPDVDFGFRVTFYNHGTGYNSANVTYTSAFRPPVRVGRYPGLIAQPAAPTLTTATTGGTLAAGTSYGYRIAALGQGGITTTTAEVAITTDATATTNTVTINWTKVPRATGYRIYGRTPAQEWFLADVGDVATFTDDGSLTPVSQAVSTTNTTADNSKTAIIIGDVGQTWSYPKVQLARSWLGYATPADAVMDGWTTTVTTDSTWSGADQLVTASDRSATAGLLTPTKITFAGAYDSGAVLNIGRTDTNYPGAQPGWAGSWNSNILLSGLDQTSISFHDSGSRVDTLRVQGRTFHLGIDAGWGVADTRIHGSLLQSIVNVTAAYTVPIGMAVVLANGTFTVTLPDAALHSGRQINVKNIGTGTITVAGGGDNIDGATTAVIGTQWASITVVSNGTQWYII